MTIPSGRSGATQRYDLFTPDPALLVGQISPDSYPFVAFAFAEDSSQAFGSGLHEANVSFSQKSASSAGGGVSGFSGPTRAADLSSGAGHAGSAMFIGQSGAAFLDTSVGTLGGPGVTIQIVYDWPATTIADVHVLVIWTVIDIGIINSLDAANGTFNVGLSQTIDAGTVSCDASPADILSASGFPPPWAPTGLVVTAAGAAAFPSNPIGSFTYTGANPLGFFFPGSASWGPGTLAATLGFVMGRTASDFGDATLSGTGFTSGVYDTNGEGVLACYAPIYVAPATGRSFGTII